MTTKQGKAQTVIKTLKENYCKNEISLKEYLDAKSILGATK